MLASTNLPKLRGHDAIHAAILIDTLQREYASVWEDKFPGALAAFISNLNLGKQNSNKGEYSEYWNEYGQRTRVNSDRGENILRRHIFYQRKMLEEMGPIPVLDTKRSFGEVERTTLFFEQDAKCQVCKQKVEFDEMEVHHIDMHSKGGKTDLENGAIVHPQCHPKSEADVEKFRSSWRSPKQQQEDLHKAILDNAD